MNDKMKRFLNSIGIVELDKFDLDFDLVTRNPLNREQVDMLIIKQTPWTFDLLEEFDEHVLKITYPYDMRFSYIKKPLASDATALFGEWHYAHYRVKGTLKLVGIGGTITTYYDGEEDKEKQKNVLKEFKQFLNHINYNFKFEERIISPQEEMTEEPKEEKKQKMTEEERAAISALKQSLIDMRHELDNNKFVSHSFRKKMPYKRLKSLAEVDYNCANIDVDGQLYGIDKPKIMRNGQTMLMAGVGFGDTAISVKIIENENMPSDFIESLKNGMWVRILGYVVKDEFKGQLQILVNSIAPIEGPELRKDECEEKRVELHLHTKMSAMDGVSTIEDYMKLAKNMGHKAIAITDHGVAQSFPEAQSCADKYGIKALYGCEFYMVNDELPFALNPVDIPLNKATYVVFDLETTGLSTKYDRITEFGGIRFENGQIVKTLDLFVNPERKIPSKIVQKTKITDEMVKNKPTIEQVIDQILEFMDGAILVSHNITFDYGFLNEALLRMGRGPLVKPAIDTLSLSHYLFPEASAHRLGNLSRNLGMDDYDDEDAHRADYDAKILNDVWLAMLARLTKENENLKHSDLAKIKSTEPMLKHMRTSHLTAIAKNEAGVKDIFELISLSHIKYFADVPKTPKREIARLRENLLLGTGCSNGEVFDIARTRSKEDLKDVLSFYDYVEIQPLENLVYFINKGLVDSIEELKRVEMDIVEAADELGKLVVATGDVHYANPEDKISRDIYIEAPAVGGKPHPLFVRNSDCVSPNQHYRTTQEMLDAFDFLGKEKAFEIVVTNTNKIADMIEQMSPIHKDLIKPEIPDSDKILTETCFEKAKELYGENIPEDIVARLNKELDGINGNGYSVTYYIANKIISQAAKDGYMVGSRGSVGSSLAAHLYGITEVNPLAPHYRCPKCKHFEYSDDPNCYSGSDLPEKKCPVCGEHMVHDGQEIPFETFLGFHAEKVPDIDLNFPSDYQARAHNLTKDIFGAENVFRAGTIGTVADKTAFGYVRRYYEQKLHIDPNTIPQERIAYMASHCTDVKRTTGQHPGGIVVLPKGRSIYEFTPIQYPADDKEADWLTTHLDYHAALDAQLLKLDLLGHVDPLALRLMSHLTGVDVKKIPLNDPKVLSLFTSTKALKMNGNYLKSRTGSSGLPEYGTDTCSDILVKAKPKTFADVVAVAGLAHGTNVWGHNQEDLIHDGRMTLHDCIAARDDIMKYLIAHGVPSEVAFDTMEKVRKGKKIPEKYLPVLNKCNIPAYYIDACNKIKYLYPKAHAVAYATMAVRVGYFKVYYPLEFYAVWFSARCDAYDIHAMLGGYDRIVARYEEIERAMHDKSMKVSNKDKAIHSMLEVCIEMAERGYKFSNVDLYKSDAKEFIIDKENGALIPPFIVIDGLGDAAAQSVVEARKNGEFSSKEDLLRRTKLNGTNVEDLSAIGALNGLGESDQMSLFEFGLDA